MRRRVARRLLREAGGSGRALGYENVERLLGALESGAVRLHLDGALDLTLDEEHATLAPIRAPGPPMPFEVQVVIPGTTVLPGCVMTADLREGVRAPSTDPWEASLDGDTLDALLMARNRRAGDRIHPLGLSGTRTVADLLTDRKVPRDFRDALPVVACGDRIAWVAGVAVSEDFKVTERTRLQVRLRVEPPLFAARAK